MQKYQKEVSEIESLIQTSTKKKLTAYGKLAMLSSELGELADEVVALEGDRVEEREYKNTNALANEIVDVIFNALTIANHYDIQVDEYFAKRLEKIKAKF